MVRTANIQLLLFFAFFLAFSNARAAVIYDESIDGDANSTGGSGLVGADVGALGFGDNAILGSAGHGQFDDYIFTVPVDGLLVSMILDLGIGSSGYGADLYTADAPPNRHVALRQWR